MNQRNLIRITGFTVILIFLLILYTGQKSEIIIVKNGKPRAIIVLPNNADKEIEEAGETLRYYIRKCTGAELNLLTESQLKETKNLPGSSIFLGNCNKTMECIDPENIKPEELIIYTNRANLFITGKDGGTLYGVYHWLREFLGVDWLMPGELGEITPFTPSLSVSQIDYKYQPPVLKRTMRNTPVSEHTVMGIERLCKDLGIQNTNDILEKVEKFYKSYEITTLFRRWGAGERISVKFGHAFNDYWEKYGSEHPEFFALQPDGTRKQHPNRERLCVSNPALWDFVAERKIEEFRENPRQQMASICPNDGGTENKMCMCQQCQSLDPDNAPKIYNAYSLVNPKTGKSYEEYPSLSDRYFTFFNEVTKRVAKIYPDKKLGTYAYSVYKTIPVNIKKLHPSLAVGLVSWDRELIDGWGKLTSQLFLRPNIWHIYFGFAQNSAHWLAENIKYSVEHGVVGFDCSTCAWNWGTEALDYYVLVRTMWNPFSDTDKLIDQYCRAAYCKAAAEMKKYHQILENLTSKMRKENKYIGFRENPEVFISYYTDEILTKLQQIIENAKSLIANPFAPEYKRILLVEEGLEYTRLACSFLRTAGKTTSSDPVYQSTQKELLKCLQSKIESFSINPGKTYFYFARAASAVNDKYINQNINKGNFADDE